MKDKILTILGELIGVETEDIKMEDSLREELHMNSVNLAELAAKLEEEDIRIDISEIDTVAELIEAGNIDEI